MKILITVIAFAGIMIVSLHPQITFENIFGGVNEDVGYYVEQTNDGDYIISGSTVSFGADVSFSVQQTTDGGYIFSDQASSSSTGDSDAYLIKTDASDVTDVKIELIFRPLNLFPLNRIIQIHLTHQQTLSFQFHQNHLLS